MPIAGRNPPYHHEGISHILIDDATVRAKDRKHASQVLVQRLQNLLGFHPLAQGGEPADADHENSDLAVLAPQRDLAGKQFLENLGIVEFLNRLNLAIALRESLRHVIESRRK